MASKKILTLTIDNKKGDIYYFSSERYITLPSDSLANQKFEPRISNDPTFSKQVNLKIWGTTRATSTIGYFDIINDDGAFDFLYVNNVFGPNTTGEIALLFDTESWDSRFVAANVIIEKIEPVGEDYLRVTVKDNSKLMEVAVGTNYDNTTASTSVRNSPRPVVIGAPLQEVPVKVNTTLNLMDVHMDQFFWYDGVSVSTRGVNAVKSIDWRFSINNTCFGIEYLVSMTGADPFTIDHAGGAVFVNTTFFTSPFTTWTGSPALPNDGWAYDGTFAAGTREFLNNGGTCRMHVTAGGVGTGLSMRKTGITIPASGTDQALMFEFDITAMTVAGSVVIEMRNSANTATLSSKTVNINGVGHYADMLTIGANTGTTVRITIGGTVIDASIDNFKLVAITNTNKPANAAYWLACVRAGLPNANFDWASWGALNVAGILYIDRVGLFAKGDAMVADCLDQIADSYTGWWWIDRLGNLRVKSLFDPVTASVPEPVNLSASKLVRGQDINIAIDMCPGLSTQWAYNKNWYAMDDNDFAGSVTDANRALYGSEYRISGKYTMSTIPDVYNHIVNAPPVETVLQNMNVTQNNVEPNRVVGYYGTVRSFKTGQWVLADSEYLALELGDVVVSDFSRFNISAIQHMVAGVDGTFLSNTVTIRLWS